MKELTQEQKDKLEMLHIIETMANVKLHIWITEDHCFTPAEIEAIMRGETV